MNADTLVREWGLITELLPSDWQDLARTKGAFQRARNVRDPSTLLLLILLHAASGLSLRQSAARAARMGIASLSDVGLLKRLRSSRDWLHALAAGMFSTSGFQTPVDGILAGRRLRVVDGTSISEPGSSGTDWRLHFSLQLPSLECDFFEVTDPSIGESYKRFPVLPGDIILADRGYAHREGVAHVIQAGGDLVVRLNTNSFPLAHSGGAPFLLLAHLRQLSGFEPGEWPIEFRAGEATYKARLCAIRKTEAAAERARDQVRKTAARKQRQVQSDTLELAEYTFVLTTLDETFTTADVLELYRARWQIETAFKRLKTLLGLGHLPKYDPDSAKAWLHAKLLAVLLIERLGERARLFSPWGFQLRRPEPLA